MSNPHDVLSSWKEERGLPLTAIHAQMSFLEGEVLTIADAIFQDRQQNKAVKDLLKAAFRKRQEYIAELCGEGNTRGSAEPIATLPA